MPKSFSARMFVALIVISGLLLLGDAVLNAKQVPTAKFLAFLLVACVAARLRIKLPGVTGTMSVNLPFILVAAAQMNTAEALAIGFISTFFQCLGKGKKFNLVQTAFNCSTITLAVAVTRLIYAAPSVASAVSSPSLRLAIAAAGYALANTVPVAIVIGLTEAAGMLRTWLEMLQLSFPYLVASAGIAGLTLTIAQEVGWQVPLAVLPIMAGIFLSYKRYFAAAVTSEAANMRVEARNRATAGANA
jgi:MASE9 protein